MKVLLEPGEKLEMKTIESWLTHGPDSVEVVILEGEVWGTHIAAFTALAFLVGLTIGLLL